MRSRLPAVLLLLLSAFLLGPAPGSAHLPGTATPATWWSGPSEHAVQDAALPRLSPARSAPALPMWPAVLPSTERPGPRARSLTTLARPFTVAPQPPARQAPARAPPSTTR